MKKIIFVFLSLFLSASLIISSENVPMDLLDFSATWCVPCRKMDPVIEKLAADFKVLKIDIDKNPDLMKQYGVTKVPTIIILKKGLVYETFVGITSEDRLRNSLNKAKMVEMTYYENPNLIRKFFQIFKVIN